MAQPPARRTLFSLTIAVWATLGLAGLLALIQAVPYGKDRAPRPATNPFQWRDPGGEALARAACYDCHSNQTRWWWAVKMAPMSWLAQSDMDEGRSLLNFSAWNGRLTPERLDRVLHRGMPPVQYTLVHPEARLSEAQKRELVDSFRRSLPLNAALPAPARLALASSPAPGAERIIRARCSSCHSANHALQYRTASPALARALVERMKRHGANLVDRFTS